MFRFPSSDIHGGPACAAALETHDSRRLAANHTESITNAATAPALCL